MVTTWKWSADDYKKGLKFKIDENTAIDFYLLPSFSMSNKLNEREVFLSGKIVISIKKPQKDFLEGLTNPSSKNSIKTAEEIYKIYKKIFNLVALYYKWFANLPYVIEGSGTSFYDVFKGDSYGSSVSWSGDKINFKIFNPKLPKSRKINPMFKGKSLLTKQKWKKLRKDILIGQLPSKEIEELVKIQGKINWGGKRIPAVEAVALMEVIIRDKARQVLKKAGQSNTKIERIGKDMELSILINLFLPIILTKKEFSKYKKYIDALDKLRSVRNDIMHKNIDESAINEEHVKNGIKAAIKIAMLLEKK